MRLSGKVNPVAVLMLLAFGGAVYWSVLFGPVYMDNLDVREAVSAAWGQYHVEGEDRAMANLLGRINATTMAGKAIGSHTEIDEESGQEKVVPGLGLTEDSVTFDFDESTKMLTVRVEYDRVVHMKPSEKRRTIHFVVEKKGVIQ